MTGFFAEEPLSLDRDRATGDYDRAGLVQVSSIDSAWLARASVPYGETLG